MAEEPRPVRVGPPLFLLDTHALYWHLVGSSTLSAAAARVFSEAQKGDAVLVVHHVVLAEIFYILQKQKQSDLFTPLLADLETLPYFRVEPLVLEDLRQLPSYPEVAEMHDRLLVIAADRLQATMITRDQNIRKSSRVSCLW